MTRARLFTPAFVIAHLVALHALIAWFGDKGSTNELGESPKALTAQADASPAATPAGQPAAQAVESTRPGVLDLAKVQVIDDRQIADLGNGWQGELTLDVGLQQQATKILERARVPLGAVVVLDIESGEVLAMAERRDATHPVALAQALPEVNGPSHVALRALAPAASVFKLLTATALLEAGVAPQQAIEYAPSPSKISASALKALGEGAPMTTLVDALAESNNGYFARAADERLQRDVLQSVSKRFHFNQVIPFPLATEASTAEVPREQLERARMAAGFWHTRLTPLHGALLAASVADEGVMPAPVLVRRLRSPAGEIIEPPPHEDLGRMMSPEHAAQLKLAMAKTVESGTGRKSFKEWPAALADVTVAGKTGSLAQSEPYTYYTWFVGFAPVDQPKVAIAVMVANGELWWDRAPGVAKNVLAWYFMRESKLKAKQVASGAVPAVPL